MDALSHRAVTALARWSRNGLASCPRAIRPTCAKSGKRPRGDRDTDCQLLRRPAMTDAVAKQGRRRLERCLLRSSDSTLDIVQKPPACGRRYGRQTSSSRRRWTTPRRGQA